MGNETEPRRQHGDESKLQNQRRTIGHLPAQRCSLAHSGSNLTVTKR